VRARAAAQQAGRTWQVRLACLLTGLFVLPAQLAAAADPAAAAAAVATPAVGAESFGGYPYGYGYGYGYDAWGFEPVPVVMPHGPPLLVLDNQYYGVDLHGVTRLCDAHPDLCLDEPLQRHLRRLRGRRIAGITLAWTGVAAAILGPVISTAVNCGQDGTYCRPDNGVVLGTVLGGLAMGITGLVLIPGSSDVLQLINRINQGHPEHPVQLRMGMLPSRDAGPGPGPVAMLLTGQY
jgi:hypothetical protein